MLLPARRQEEVRVKMVTADDDSTTDITVEGDEEELDRMRCVLRCAKLRAVLHLKRGG